MKKGDRVYTPRFCTCVIEEVLTDAEAREKGYSEPTYYESVDYDIRGKCLGESRMCFAAVKRDD